MKNSKRYLMTTALAGALLLAACGDSDSGDAAPTQTQAPSATEAPAPATTEVMDDEMLPADVEALVAELAATEGVSEDQARCAIDAAAAEFGAETLVAAGDPTDVQLLTIVNLIEGCA